MVNDLICMSFPTTSAVPICVAIGVWPFSPPPSPCVPGHHLCVGLNWILQPEDNHLLGGLLRELEESVLCISARLWAILLSSP